MKAPFPIFLVLAGALLLAGCGGSATDLPPGLDLQGRIQEYESAINSGDPAATLALLTEDARWQLPTRKESLDIETIRTSLEMDEAMGIQVEFSDCEVSDLVVNCRMTERNDWLSLHGIEKWEQPQVRFVFNEDGRIRVVSWIGRDEAVFSELVVIWKSFRAWAKQDESRYERFMSMVDMENERLYWDRPTAETLLALGQEWVDEGRPGLEETRAMYAAEKARSSHEDEPQD